MRFFLLFGWILKLIEGINVLNRVYTFPLLIHCVLAHKMYSSLKSFSLSYVSVSPFSAFSTSFVNPPESRIRNAEENEMKRLVFKDFHHSMLQSDMKYVFAFNKNSNKNFQIFSKKFS